MLTDEARQLQAEFSARWRESRERLKGLREIDRPPLALKTLMGDKTAEQELDKLDRQITSVESEMKNLSDAIDACSGPNAQQRERTRQERERQGRKQRAPVMLHQLAQRRESLVENIERFEASRNGDRQGALYRRELEKLDREIADWQKEIAA